MTTACRNPRAWLAGALLAFVGPPAHADLTGFQFTWENDSWLRGGTDRWYTNGIRGSWGWACKDDQPVSKVLQSAASLVNVGDMEWSCTGERATPKVVYTLGQTMYTPNDITKAHPQPDDRPWAGFLYVAASTLSHAGSTSSASEIKVGITGPASHADDAQRLIHRVFNAPRPEGWIHQLRGRLGVQLTHARAWQAQPLNGRWLALQYGLGGSVGTLRTFGTASAAVIIGSLQGQTAPAFIGNEGDFVVQDFKNRPQYRHPYGFLAANVTGVSYNYFLEGRTPYGKARLEPHRSYTMFSAGFSLPLDRYFSGRWPRVVYTQSVRTAEFRTDTLDRNEARQRWGTLTLNWDTN